MEVELAKRSMRVLNFVSVSLLSLIAPRITHLQVSFCRSQTIIIMGTFDSSASGISGRLGVSAVGLGEIEKSLDRLLIWIGVSDCGGN